MFGIPDNTVSDLRSDIRKIRTKLILKAKSQGLYEDFGQKEFRQLNDKYGRYIYESKEVNNLLFGLNEWAMSYIPGE